MLMLHALVSACHYTRIAVRACIRSITCDPRTCLLATAALLSPLSALDVVIASLPVL
jgi:hypothetical protein